MADISKRSEGSSQPFFEPAEGGFEATELTRGPWDADSQHAGPPTALLAREIELTPGIGEQPSERIVGRITSEILRPVPIARLELSARVVRPGRRVDMVEAELRCGDEPLIRARAWRLAAREVGVPAGLRSTDPGGEPSRAGRPSGGQGPPPAPESVAEATEFFPTDWEIGYHTAMEVRFAAGGFNDRGPATAWMRSRIPLVGGEELTPLQRVMVAADSGNGISSTLDFDRFTFINVDLSVHLHRMPEGEWICLDALTTPEPTGVGMADTLLFDASGPIGRACQTLLVSER